MTTDDHLRPAEGDIVVFKRSGTVDWEVERVSGDLVELRSGMTGRRTRALTYELEPSPRQSASERKGAARGD